MLSHRNPKPGNGLTSYTWGIHKQWAKRDSNKGELLLAPKGGFWGTVAMSNNACNFNLNRN